MLREQIYQLVVDKARTPKVELGHVQEDHARVELPMSPVCHVLRSADSNGDEFVAPAFASRRAGPD